MVETRRLDQLINRLLDISDFPEGDLLVALSGGPDSASLAQMASLRGSTVRAVHIDHGTEHSEPLRSAAVSIGAVLGLEVEVIAIDLTDGRFTEERARSARYAAFQEVRASGEWILTGHTREDQAETVMMNLVRGAGPSGLGGIPRRTASHVARPLLDAARADLRELAMLSGLPFVDDPSNEDPRFTRNTVRHELIPYLEARYNPGLVAALSRAARLLQADAEHLEAEGDRLPVAFGDGRAIIPRSVLVTTTKPVADRLLRRALARLRPPHGPTSDEMEKIWSVVRSESSGATLKGGIRIEVVGPSVEISVSTIDLVASRLVDLSVGRHRIGSWSIEVARDDGPCRVVPLSRNAAIFPGQTALSALIEDSGNLVVKADEEIAWIPGGRRHPVAFYEPGTNGYLSVFAIEEHEWT
jgi:tRNA(Ile)-lysidine synthetase-like protein